MRRLTLGTRGSQLALVQSRFVQSELRRAHPDLDIEIRVIRTTGDAIQDRPLHQIGGDGLFIKAIESALLNEEIDLAVHSMKDLPSAIPEGLRIAAVPQRRDARDAFVGDRVRTIQGLPPKARIATGSLRRKSQLLKWRRDLVLLPLRGNVPTRIEKLDGADWDGIILAAAGLERLGLSERIAFPIPPDIMLPAVGQGGLAVEIRAADDQVAALVQPLNDDDSAVAIESERALLKRLAGGCQVPIAGHATLHEGTIRLEAYVGSEDGTTSFREALEGPRSESTRLGLRLAEKMLEAGAETLVASFPRPEDAGRERG